MDARTRLIGLVIAALIVVAACSSAESDPGADATNASGFIFLDSTGSHICGSMMESYPPQCGKPSVKLLDLDPESVVALMSPSDPTLEPVSWTEYELTVTGDAATEGLVRVHILDPAHLSDSSGLVLRVADLGIAVGDPATWPLDLTNLTDTDTTLTFTDGQRVEVTLSDDSGEVYRWSDGMFFTQAIEKVDLPAGATFPYVLTADPLDLDPGTYTAKAWVTATEASDVVVTWEIVIENR
jgi:hypothetical protein